MAPSTHFHGLPLGGARYQHPPLFLTLSGSSWILWRGKLKTWTRCLGKWSMPPSGDMLSILLGLDLSGVSEAGRVTALVVIERLKAALDHMQLSLLRQVTDTTEIALALRWTERALVRRTRLAEALTMLPQLSELMRSGDLDARRLETIYQRVQRLPDPGVADEHLAEIAPDLNPTQLARRTTQLVGRLDPDGLERRHTTARQERRVEFTPLPDGMAETPSHPARTRGPADPRPTHPRRPTPGRRRHPHHRPTPRRRPGRPGVG